MGYSNDSLSPPPLPPPPPMATTAVKNSGSSSTSYNPSLLIIGGLLAFVCLASTSIHLLLRFLSRASSPSSPLINRNVSSGSTATATATSTSSPASDKDPKSLIDSLPLFSLASSLATLPKSSHNCAVCLSRFNPHDELRLLPACRHAFHSPCIDTWLRTTPSCPLCRSSIDRPPATESDSFRVEIGSITRRRAPEQTPAPPPTAVTTPPETQSYSVGSSFEYRVEDEVEAVVARVRSRVEEEVVTRTSPGPLPPGEAVAEAAGEGGKSWLKEYVDRLASAASSPLSSLRFSSPRFDGGDERT